MNSRTGRLGFLAIIVVYVIYATLFIYKTSFLFEGERYFVLFDDAMISMRYAKNLAAGLGPVWNPGERIEGYTNPLWVVYMSIFHLFPIPASKTSLFIQVSGVITVVISLYFIKKIAESLTNSRLVSLLCVALTAFYLPINTWTLEGMEVGALMMLLSIAVWGALRTYSENRIWIWMYILLGISTLIRFDMIVSYLTILGWMVISDSPNRKSHLLTGGGILFVFIVTQTIFRVVYFGDFLPNTYYLKMTGAPLLLRLERGVFVFLTFIWNSYWPLFILPFLLLLYRRDKNELLLFLVFLSQVVYSIYIGGDAWEHKGGANRFISLGMPFFFILFSYASEYLRQILLGAMRDQPLFAKPLSNVGLVIFVFISMLNFNSLLDTRSLERWLLMSDPLFVQANRDYVPMAHAIRAISEKEATIAVVSAGAIPYFSERISLDLLGKSDKEIAREEMHIPKDIDLLDFRPGHMKWNYAYSIGELQPDIVVQLWKDSETAQPYLEQDYSLISANGYSMYVRNGSSHIHWSGLERTPEQPTTIEP